jgi:RND family efflux transporter MFP subunit
MVVWLLALTAALTACKQETEVPEVVRTIKTITVSEADFGQALKLSGLVAAIDTSDLSFQVGGQIEIVNVDIGDVVKKDKILAELDPEPYQLEVDKIAAQLGRARDDVVTSQAEYERQKRIYEQGAGAKRYLDVAENQYKAAKSSVNVQIAKLDLAKRNLRKTKLVAPFDGTIAWRSAEAYEEVQAGQKLFEINAPGNYEVQIAVPETSIDLLQIDDAAAVTFPTLPGESVKGRISYIGSAALQSNAFPVKIELIDPNEKIKPGMTAEATISIEPGTQTSGHLIPLQAIVPSSETDQGYAFVYDAQTSTVKKTQIRVRGMSQDKTIRVDGLNTGDIIAVAGVSFLADGMQVKLMKQE